MQSDTSIISDLCELPPLLDVLAGLPVDPPSLYLGLKGADLGRLGSSSLLLLHVVPRLTAYIIDIHMLSADAFSTKNTTGASLKTIFESPHISKGVLIFRANGIIELRLLELATREITRSNS